jgi:hypothetical protein
MALEPKISVCYHNCSELKVTDISGLYNADSNLTGWNSPNATSSDVTAVNLTINSNGTILTDQLPAEINGDFAYTLADQILADGFYDMTYTVDYSMGSPLVATTVTYELTEFITCSARCCIDKMWLRVADDHCNCSKGDLMTKAIEAEALLKAAQTSAAACGNRTQAVLLLEAVTDLCAFEECNCK